MKQKLYNAAVILLCLTSIALAIKDLRQGLTPAQVWADRIIYGFFVADYLVRLILAEDKRAFVKGNVFDLIAIIPFSSLFRAFRLARFARVLRLLRLAASPPFSWTGGKRSSRSAPSGWRWWRRCTTG